MTAERNNHRLGSLTHRDIYFTQLYKLRTRTESHKAVIWPTTTKLPDRTELEFCLYSKADESPHQCVDSSDPTWHADYHADPSTWSRFQQLVCGRSGRWALPPHLVCSLPGPSWMKLLSRWRRDTGVMLRPHCCEDSGERLESAALASTVGFIVLCSFRHSSYQEGLAWSRVHTLFFPDCPFPEVPPLPELVCLNTYLEVLPDEWGSVCV